MKTLICLTLAFGFAVASPCTVLITLLSKCAEFGITYGQVQCGSLASTLHKELSSKLSPRAALVISDACYSACILQADFFNPETITGIYNACREDLR